MDNPKVKLKMPYMMWMLKDRTDDRYKLFLRQSIGQTMVIEISSIPLINNEREDQ